MRLRRALDEMVVEGIETTLPLFRALVREPAIIDGDYHIHWLEQYLAGQPRRLSEPSSRRKFPAAMEPIARIRRLPSAGRASRSGELLEFRRF